MMTHVDGGATNFKCSQCQKCFYNKSSLQRHTRDMHGLTQRVECNFVGCSKTFKGRQTMNEHFARVHAEEKMPARKFFLQDQQDQLTRRSAQK